MQVEVQEVHVVELAGETVRVVGVVIVGLHANLQDVRKSNGQI